MKLVVGTFCTNNLVLGVDDLFLFNPGPAVAKCNYNCMGQGIVFRDPDRRCNRRLFFICDKINKLPIPKIRAKYSIDNGSGTFNLNKPKIFYTFQVVSWEIRLP